MSNSWDRFYQLKFRNRPVMFGDIGSHLKIDGLVVAGGGSLGVLLLPSSETKSLEDPSIIRKLSLEEWSDFLQRSDMPEILVNPLTKAFHRKSRYEISGLVQQKVYAADGFKCMYCKRPMGEVQLTVDHFFPLELGGKNEDSNYLSACRRCNKAKANMDPVDWCEMKGLNYNNLVSYLSLRRV